MSSNGIAVAPLLQGFFYDWLIKQLGLSAYTIRSYRDTWKLFLRFAADRHHRPVAKLRFEDLTAPQVVDFLEHVEQDRKVTVGTRNCRLAALRSFYSFVASREPLAVAQCAAVLHTPTKRAATRAPTYLEPQEIELILSAIKTDTAEGQRDHALLNFLYNTGARIQEALDVCPRDIRFETPPCVRLFGKGRKERLCPLWPETVALIKALLRRQPRVENEPVFISRYGRPIGASGIRYKLAGYVAAAAKVSPTLLKKHVTPHSFRHAAAVSLVSSGTDVTVIRSWLGHASLDTTNLYAQANIATKREALERLEPPFSRRPRWKRESGLIEWLESL
jgi:site-specific recombinase XerD